MSQRSLEHLGQQLDAGEINLPRAAHLLQQYSDGGLTALGALDLMEDWRTARSRYEHALADTAVLLARVIDDIERRDADRAEDLRDGRDPR